MNLRRDDLTRTARAPAKLNLVLDVLGRREDGFHMVETLMVPVRLADSISFAPLRPGDCSAAGEIRLDILPAGPLRSRQESAPIPAGSQNLIVRALQLLRQRSGCRLGARVELVKRIPAAAGLGGGSSDAAAALRLANRGWGIHWRQERLAELAAEIGSDVPFFVYGGAAVCRGRGEKVERLPPVAPLDVVVVKPPVELSTAEVYIAYDALPAAMSGHFAPPLAAMAAGRAGELAHRMRNALQHAASSLSPWVDRLRAVFDEFDFVGHQLSGSGSAYFGVCRHPRHARRLANILRSRQLGLVYATRSCP
jgi:4-diphosphocytidyl-2-C-methyl-D-erythritol kinase